MLLTVLLSCLLGVWLLPEVLANADEVQQAVMTCIQTDQGITRGHGPGGAGGTRVCKRCEINVKNTVLCFSHLLHTLVPQPRLDTLVAAAPPGPWPRVMP